MRTFAGVLFCLYLASVCAVAQVGEKFVVVRLSDFAKDQHREVMSAAELKKTEARYALEARLFQRCLTLAELDWKKNEPFGRKPFPRGAVSARSVTVVGRHHGNEESARAKLDAYENQARALELRKAERTKRIPKRLRPAVTVPDYKRLNEHAKARELFEMRLQELLSGAEKDVAE